MLVFSECLVVLWKGCRVRMHGRSLGLSVGGLMFRSVVSGPKLADLSWLEVPLKSEPSDSISDPSKR